MVLMPAATRLRARKLFDLCIQSVLRSARKIIRAFRLGTSASRQFQAKTAFLLDNGKVCIFVRPPGTVLERSEVIPDELLSANVKTGDRQISAAKAVRIERRYGSSISFVFQLFKPNQMVSFDAWHSKTKFPDDTVKIKRVMGQRNSGVPFHFAANYHVWHVLKEFAGRNHSIWMNA